MVSRTKHQPKEEVFGADVPRTSGVIRVDIPGQNFSQGPRNPGKTSILVRTSMTDVHDLKGFPKTFFVEKEKIELNFHD